MTGQTKGLEFPCVYPIKAMGLTADDFDAVVVGIVRRHIADIREGAVTSRSSTNSKYTSITIEVHVTDRAQLEAIYRDLRADKRVLMTL